MDDLISRQAAIDAIGKKSDEIYKTKQKGATYPHDDFFQGMAYAGNVVEQMPSAQAERMRGKWKKGVGENGVTTSLFCSECNYENTHWHAWNYCPNCGADMRGEQHG